MSSVVKTVTPFLNKEVVLQALRAIGCQYTLQGDDIVTDRVDYYGSEKFVFLNGRYSFSHDSSAENMRFGPHYPWGNINAKGYKTVSAFLARVEKHYHAILEQRRAEEERIRAEAERLRLEKKRLEEERLRLEQERKNALVKAERRRLEEERLRQEALIEVEQKRIEEERLKIEAERKRLEEERIRQEQERAEYVEKQRTTIIAKAKEKGYTVHEEKLKEKIKLDLVRNTY